MGTNYYIVCNHCNERVRHIGKLSAGHAFTFQEYEDKPTSSWVEWRKLLDTYNRFGFKIIDEYGRDIMFAELLLDINASATRGDGFKFIKGEFS